MGQTPLYLWVVMATIAASAIVGALRILAVRIEFHRELHFLKREAIRLRKEQIERIRAIYEGGNQITSAVDILDDDGQVLEAEELKAA